MLEQILNYIHNYFPYEILTGQFVIEDGALKDVELLDGQYFKVIGSVLNDGVHQKGDALSDETFEGQVWTMAVPKAVLGIAQEVEDWMAKYGEAVNGPYQSESFGGYSYSKATDASAGSTAGWQSVFGKRLNAYRKINGDA